MKGFSFPIFKTKIEGVTETFKLEDPVERRKYFEAKAGEEIEKLKTYLEKNTFVAILLGPKNSGKGTYTKLFMEAVGEERVAHLSIGDVVRSAHEELEDATKKGELVAHLERTYRGFVPLAQAIDIILGRDTKSLLPTEIVLSLLQREIDRMGRRAIFIDGFPRNLDQVSYSLFFRNLMGYRDDPDFFVFIDLPESVIDERMKFRVICSLCKTPRNIKLLRTKDVGYDARSEEFYLICDNPNCEGFGKERMVPKEGDELGIEAIRDRLEGDGAVMRKLQSLEGVPKIYLRNAVPVAEAAEFVDEYEITPAYRYERAGEGVKVIEEPWIIKDDKGIPSYSLLPPAVGLSLIKQIAQVLGL